MQKESILIPIPKSSFQKIQCTNCEKQTIIYTHSTNSINCNSCNELLVKNTGGKAKIYGNVLESLE
ncbi:MAG: 30S ribosomal protein S27e [Nitrososphaeraceae archaeon]